MSELSPPSRRRGLKFYTETCFFDADLSSPPSRRRGLKSAQSIGYIAPQIVASFAEAWIEIIIVVSSPTPIPSPPSRRRGLKFDKVPYDAWEKEGRLLRGGVD